MVCNATKNQILIKLLKGALKLTEEIQEVISNEVPYQKFKTCKLQLSALRVFEIPEITSTVEFISSETGANGFSTTEMLQTAAKTFREGLQVYLKRTSS